MLRPAQRSLALCLPLALSAGLASSTARANGRFPRADQLVLVPGSADELVLRTTFGLLVSSDAGANWHWVCERAIGFSGIEDPALEVLPNGLLLAGLLEGLAQSADRGCSWQLAATPQAELQIVDLSAREDAPSLAVALAWERQSATASAPGYRSRFFASSDGGASWHAQGSGIDPGVLVLTLDVAPSDPHRLYASGIRSGAARTAALFVSLDDGATWSERPAPFEARTEQGLYIAAVDPVDADLVYLRTSGSSSSRLFVTADAGATFAETYSGGPLLGFALSPDGAQIYLGGADDGLWVGARGELAFEQRSQLPIVCLAAGPDSLYACSNDLGGFALGTSRDGGRSFTPLLVLSDVRGPLACLSGGSSGMCAADWPAMSSRLGIRPGSESLAPNTLPPNTLSPNELPSAPAVPSSVVSAATAPEGGGCSLPPYVLHRPRSFGSWLAALGAAAWVARRRLGPEPARAGRPQSM